MLLSLLHMKIGIVRVANCHAHNLMFNNFRRQYSFNITLQVINVWFTLITSMVGITPVALRSDRHNPSQCTGNKTSLQSRDCWVNLCLVGTFGFTYKVASLSVFENLPCILNVSWSTLGRSGILAESRVQIVGDLVEVALRLFHLLHVLPQEDCQVFGNALVCLIQ